MVIRALIFAIICCFTITSSVFSKKNYMPREEVFLINTIESANSFISYVAINGSYYIVKQKKDSKKNISVVRDALAAYIVKDLSIAHSVKIIPSHKEFIGKRDVLSPATLLTIAPGATIRSQPDSKYYNLCLKQRFPEGELLPHRWLTEKIIHQMTWHKQLPVIIGLDLFICNTDRHGGNLFYDSKADCFCAIDMDNIFRRDLPALAYEKLKLMIQNKKQFTKKEIKALVIMRDTIKFLLDKYTPKKLIEKLHFFIKKANFIKGASIEPEKLAKKIARHESIIVQSRSSAYKLIELLNKIVEDIEK